MTMALLKHRPAGAQPILAADFARAMLRRGAHKFAAAASGGASGRSASGRNTFGRNSGAPYAFPIEADALHLPLRAESLDLIVTAFGFRNLANYEAGLPSFTACSSPAASSAFSSSASPADSSAKPMPSTSAACCPPSAGSICGKNGPYNYLPTSVGNFPPPPQCWP